MSGIIDRIVCSTAVEKLARKAGELLAASR